MICRLGHQGIVGSGCFANQCPTVSSGPVRITLPCGSCFWPGIVPAMGNPVHGSRAQQICLHTGIGLQPPKPGARSSLEPCSVHQQLASVPVPSRLLLVCWVSSQGSSSEKLGTPGWGSLSDSQHPLLTKVGVGASLACPWAALSPVRIV